MFEGGVRQGMMQAHHMTGIMVVLAVTFRSTQGTNLLLNESCGAQKEFFDNPQKVRDWSTLVETLLMFEAWLRQDTYKVSRIEDK